MSSTATRLPYDLAEAAAGAFSVLVADVCLHLMVCGSLRRRAENVGDVELVAVPKLVTQEQHDLFDEVIGRTVIDLLWSRLDTLAEAGRLVKRRRSNGTLVWGPHAKAFSYLGRDVPPGGVPFDLYTPEHERAGWIILLRTGPAAFSRQLVVEIGRRTRDGRPGLMPTTVRAVDGWLVDRASGQRLTTPTESSALAALGLPFVEPWERV